MKIQIDHIINEALGVGAALGLIGGLILIGNKFFGLFSYAGMPSEQIGAVIKNFTDNYTIISSVSGRSIWGRDYKRGIMMGKGGILYYYRFEYQNGAPVKIDIYPTVFEVWDRDPAIFDSATFL